MLKTISVLLTAVSLIACDSDSEGQPDNKKLDGVAISFTHPNTVTGSLDLKSGTVFYGPGLRGKRLFFNNRGNPISEEAIRESMPLVDPTWFSRIVRARDGSFQTIYPGVNHPDGVWGDRLFAKDNYQVVVSETDIRTSISEQVGSIDLVSWTESFMIIRTSTEDKPRHFVVVIENNQVVFSNEITLEKGDEIECLINNNGQYQLLVSEIHHEQSEFVLFTANYTLSRSSSADFIVDDDFRTVNYNPDDVIDISCIEDNLTDDWDIVVTSYYLRFDHGTDVLGMTTDERSYFLRTEGEYKFNWGANVYLRDLRDAVQILETEEIIPLSENPEDSLLHLAWNESRDELCWLMKQGTGSTLNLSCKFMSEMVAAE